MATITGLHLQYRLWIADMNANIDVLRILNDYLKDDTITNESDTAALNSINTFKDKFLNLRNELDELRHEMHLNKMKLASLKNEQDQPIKEIETTIGHKALKERYNNFSETFIKIKNEFQKFENARQ